jgi:hypothetical protein
MRWKSITLACLSTMLFVSSSRSQWIVTDDPTKCLGVESADDFSFVVDAQGNLFLATVRSNSLVVYKFSHRGVLNWRSQVVDNPNACISCGLNYSSTQALVPDDEGGVIVVWPDYRSSTPLEYPYWWKSNAIRAQKINSLGETLWHQDGEGVVLADDRTSIKDINGITGVTSVLYDRHGGVYVRCSIWGGWALDSLAQLRIIHADSTGTLHPGVNGKSILSFSGDDRFRDIGGGFLDYRSSDGTLTATYILGSADEGVLYHEYAADLTLTDSIYSDHRCMFRNANHRLWKTESYMGRDTAVISVRDDARAWVTPQWIPAYSECILTNLVQHEDTAQELALFDQCSNELVLFNQWNSPVRYYIGSEFPVPPETIIKSETGYMVLDQWSATAMRYDRHMRPLWKERFTIFRPVGNIWMKSVHGDRAGGAFIVYQRERQGTIRVQHLDGSANPPLAAVDDRLRGAYPGEIRLRQVKGAGQDLALEISSSCHTTVTIRIFNMLGICLYGSNVELHAGVNYIPIRTNMPVMGFFCYEVSGVHGVVSRGTGVR